MITALCLFARFDENNSNIRHKPEEMTLSKYLD